MENYTVTLSLEVRAESDDGAIDAVADAIRRGYEGSGIAPVGNFRVEKGAPQLLDRLPKNG